MLIFICLVIFGLILSIATCVCLWKLLMQKMPQMQESAQKAQDMLGQLRQYLELIFGKELFRRKSKRQAKKEENEPVQDAEFRDVEPDKESKMNDVGSEPQPAKNGKTGDNDQEHKQEAGDNSKAEEPAKIPGSYERVELHLSSGVDYIEYFYFDDNDNPMVAAKATKCLIRECSADGTVLRELWGKPYKNQIYDHMRDIFKRN